MSITSELNHVADKGSHFFLYVTKVIDMRGRCIIHAQKTKRYAKFQQSGDVHATQGKIVARIQNGWSLNSTSSAIGTGSRQSHRRWVR